MQRGPIRELINAEIACVSALGIEQKLNETGLQVYMAQHLWTISAVA